MKTEQLPEWFAVAISIISLVVSVVESRSNKKRVEREEFRLLLDNFLLPLRTILTRTRKGFEYLTKGLEINRLEYSPQNLRDLFGHLPDERKVFWQLEIGQLQDDDGEAVDLIDNYVSRSRVDAKFQTACADFRKHAIQWKGRWDYVLSIEQEGSVSELNNLIADPFPPNFEHALRAEVKRVRSAVGAPDI
jgi:hypothetical protein